MSIEEKLDSVLLNESPILFLGAGFSLGGLLKNGNPVPTGNGLKEHLISSYLKLQPKDTEYSQLLNYNLDKVCEYIETIESKKKISDYLLDFLEMLNQLISITNCCHINGVRFTLLILMIL